MRKQEIVWTECHKWMWSCLNSLKLEILLFTVYLQFLSFQIPSSNSYLLTYLFNSESNLKTWIIRLVIIKNWTDKCRPYWRFERGGWWGFFTCFWWGFIGCVLFNKNHNYQKFAPPQIEHQTIFVLQGEVLSRSNKSHLIQTDREQQI